MEEKDEMLGNGKTYIVHPVNFSQTLIVIPKTLGEGKNCRLILNGLKKEEKAFELIIKCYNILFEKFDFEDLDYSSRSYVKKFITSKPNIQYFKYNTKHIIDLENVLADLKKFQHINGVLNILEKSESEKIKPNIKMAYILLIDILQKVYKN
jgi:hypothetical protein